MTIGGFCLTVLATTSSNVITFLLYQAVVSTGWFKGIRIHLTEELDKIDPKAEKKYE